MKKLISVFLLLISLFGLSGCFLNKENPWPYRGEHKELYTTAIYNIPNSVGCMHHGEGAYDADIYIWEQDDYGRILYSYCEDYSNRVFALLINQAYDDTSTFFYPDKNYALTYIDSECCYEGVEKNHLKNKTYDFYLSVREKLKNDNDWNKPIDLKKCVSYSITNHKVIEKDTLQLNKDQCNEILNEYTKTLNFINPSSNPYRYNTILQVDSEGKILHQVIGNHAYYDKLEWNKWDPYAKEYTYYDIVIWVITDLDGNYDKDKGILVMYSKENVSNYTFIYETSVIEKFKLINGWTYQYCE